MTINRVSGGPSNAAPSRRAAPGAGGDFRAELKPGVDSASPVRQAQPVAATGGLLALQEVGDGRTARRKAVRRASDLLDMLEAIRLDLLDGSVGEERLSALLKLVSGQREAITDPRLAHVLDEIELRARVELAKLTRTA